MASVRTEILYDHSGIAKVRHPGRKPETIGVWLEEDTLYRMLIPPIASKAVNKVHVDHSSL
jgi:hypothetical protein